MTAPSWMTEGASEVRKRQIERDYAAMPKLRPVPLPVDITDAARFPEFAEAIEHARNTVKLGEGSNGTG